jgi:hypothetical protein
VDVPGAQAQELRDRFRSFTGFVVMMSRRPSALAELPP